MASVRVAVRVRPMNRREKDLMAKCIIRMEGTRTSITNLKLADGVSGDSTRDVTKSFTYDFSYDSSDSRSSTFASQEKVFRDLGTDVLKAAFEGYNACVFAYGQTGSGKSYTMMGTPGDAGLIPRICEGLFSRIAEASRWDEASFRTEVSYLEIYNERVRDLLRRKSTQTYNLRVREHPKDGPYVEDLSKHLVQNYGDVEELMEAGNINRTTASTGMNDVSSRSHAIFTINFTQAKFDAEMPSETVSKIHLVDLAGSERADATGATGVRLKEGGNINKSLVTLGNVISALADMAADGGNTNLRRRPSFVPYRDSVLTWLLRDSLGGNSKTFMIATVSPAHLHYGETLSTLRYANRAKNIVNQPTVNEDANVRLIRELRAEIARLRALLLHGNQVALLDPPTALSMEEKLHQNEARVLELTKEWTNKWNETQNILKEETLALRKEGIGVVLDSELPHLIGIDDDLLSTGIILYHLKEGRTVVGREDASSEPDIVLHGLDLESDHCVFENQNGTVTLVPLGGAQCSVNGVQVTEPSQLNQGAVILLGRTNMFRFNHPKEAAKLREKRKSGLLSTFSLSMTDLSQSCENLSTVMLYNPGLEFERQQREELEKLEMKRRMLLDMEARQQSEKEALQRLQQEVQTRLQDLLVQKERLEEQRRQDQDQDQDLDLDLLVQKERLEEQQRQDQDQDLDLLVQKERLEEQQEKSSLHQEEQDEEKLKQEKLKLEQEEQDEEKLKLKQEKLKLEQEEQEEQDEEKLKQEKLKLEQEQEEQDEEELGLLWSGAQQEEQLRRKEEVEVVLEPREQQEEKERKHQPLRSSASPEPEGSSRTELDQQSRLQPEIQDLLLNRTGTANRTSNRDLDALLPLSDHRISAYIEEEVQRRLRKMNLQNGGEPGPGPDPLRDDDKLKSENPRRLKYEHLVSRPTGAGGGGADAVRVSVPRYVLRGQGKDEHFEFEVKICVSDETWSVFRRYSRFRELHKSLRLRYPELAALEFPPKKLFGNRDERMVAERRAQLERYLRSVFRVVLASGAGPFGPDQDGVLRLSKLDVYELSPFFKKGVFDSSSHGTG